MTTFSGKFLLVFVNFNENLYIFNVILYDLCCIHVHLLNSIFYVPFTSHKYMFLNLNVSVNFNNDLRGATAFNHT